MIDVFKPILFKGTRVLGTQEFREKVAHVGPFPMVTGQSMQFPVIRYTGTSKNPQWMDGKEQMNFETISHITADISKAPCISGVSPLGFQIFVRQFEVIYIYGQTEFKAQMAWTEGYFLWRTEKRSDVAVLYDDEDRAQRSVPSI